MAARTDVIIITAATNASPSISTAAARSNMALAQPASTSLVNYYKMTGRVVDTTTYHTWVVTGSPDALGVSAPVGGLVDIVVSSQWQKTS